MAGVLFDVFESQGLKTAFNFGFVIRVIEDRVSVGVADQVFLAMLLFRKRVEPIIIIVKHIVPVGLAP